MINKRIIVINSEKLETRVAILNDTRLEEYQVERKVSERIVGSVYVGKIVNIQTSLSAVFVDIGLEKNAFMHFSDMVPATYETDSIKKTKKNNEINIKDIPKRFPVGSEILVQITKGPIGTKGPRCTANISLPGRYLVFLPYSDHVGISKKIEEVRERDRLRSIMSKLDLPSGTGCICRTVGAGRKSVFFKRDLNMMLEKWDQIEKTRKKGKVPCVAYREPTLLEKSMRDILTEDIDEVVIDEYKDFEYIKDFISRLLSKNKSKMVTLYQKAKPVFEFYHIKEQIDRIFEREVELPSGGYICIDETEALISIDVNTGQVRSDTDKAKTIFQTNIEAADEVARQLRLRNIGGLVVIDFIDMFSASDRETVLKRMRKQVKNDRSKTKILPISEFGLMQMTRQRDKESLRDTIYDPCPYCNGRGKVKSPLSISVEIQRALKKVLKRRHMVKDLTLRVIMHPSVLARLKNEDAHFLQELEDKYGKDLSFRADIDMHVDKFKFIDTETGDELQV